MSDTLSTLLNKCEALIASGFSSISKCAAEIGERPQRVSEWVTQRAHDPSGSVALKLQSWCAAQTIRMAASGAKQQTAYRQKYRDVTEKRRPGNGKD
jgi:hypothetical protein